MVRVYVLSTTNEYEGSRNFDGSLLLDTMETERSPCVTAHAYFTTLAFDAQLDREAVEEMAIGEDAITD
jgi:hypothetical protein